LIVAKNSADLFAVIGLIGVFLFFSFNFSLRLTDVKEPPYISQVVSLEISRWEWELLDPLSGAPWFFRRGLPDYVYGLVPILVLLMLHYDTMGIAHVNSQNDVYSNVKF
jgi:hypothetical protein